MKTIFTFIILSASLLSVWAEEPLPKGVKVKTDGKDVVILIEEGASVAIKQSKEGGKTLLLGNVDGIVTVLQLLDNGKTPLAIDYIADNKAKISIKRGASIIMDNDGDGIPDIKIDKTGRYKLKEVVWEKVKNPAEQGASPDS